MVKNQHTPNSSEQPQDQTQTAVREHCNECGSPLTGIGWCFTCNPSEEGHYCNNGCGGLVVDGVCQGTCPDDP